MTAQGDGFLVVLSDVKARDEKDHLAWLTTEHVHERLSIPGFLGVRIFRRSIADGFQYFIWYRLDGPDVVDSSEYLRRLDDPTPWSRRIMPILGRFGRGGGAVVASICVARGDRILVFALDDLPDKPAEIISSLVNGAGIGAVHLLATDMAKSAVQTSERELRTSDSSFGGLLIVESMEEGALAQFSAPPVLRARKENSANGIYREVFSLSSPTH